MKKLLQRSNINEEIYVAEMDDGVTLEIVGVETE